MYRLILTVFHVYISVNRLLFYRGKTTRGVSHPSLYFIGQSLKTFECLGLKSNSCRKI
jgi:hypothetical protein